MARKADLNDPDFLQCIIAILIHRSGPQVLTNDDLAVVADYYLRTQANPDTQSMTFSVSTREEAEALIAKGESEMIESTASAVDAFREEMERDFEEELARALLPPKNERH